MLRLAMEDEFDVVTGAFSYTGGFIAHALVTAGRRVRTLTGHPERNSDLASVVEAYPYDFDNPDRPTRSLHGCATLYNTYWIRFPHAGRTFTQAILNSRRLFEGARRAGVGRVVHISVSNADAAPELPYFRGKAEVERALKDSGVPYSIVRPTLIFGPGDILINNIAWMLRRFPIFLVARSGDYRVEPILGEDVATVAIAAARGEGNSTIDAFGPENFTFRELVEMIARAVGSGARIVSAPAPIVSFAGSAIGAVVGDVTLTRDELRGLMKNLLICVGAPTGSAKFSDWISANASTVGRTYASENHPPLQMIDAASCDTA
jgi:nucleoside-diphosphate-sugar epimerase